MLDMSCIFCKISQGKLPAKIIYDDERLLAFHDIRPVSRVHLLIIPKMHIQTLYDCNETHADLLSSMLLLAPKLAHEHGLEGFRTTINTGADGGQEVFHLHLHVFGGSRLNRL